MTNILLDELQTMEMSDQTATGTGYTPVPAGIFPARLVGYVENGKRPQQYQGEERDPHPTVTLTFELLHSKQETTRQVDGVDVKTYRTIQAKNIPLKFGKNASFSKIFKQMKAHYPDVTHMAQLLNKAFTVKVSHRKWVTPQGKEIVLAEIKNEGVWGVSAPVRENSEGDLVERKVPPATTPLRLLLWDNPTEAQWNSLFIDGEYTTKDDAGNETIHSKNVIQEDILNNALDFEGSSLQALLSKIVLPQSVKSPDKALDDGDIVDKEEEEEEDEYDIEMDDFDDLGLDDEVTA